MKNFKITIENTFHNTAATMLVKNGWLNRLQVTALKNKLCGSAGCTCGGAHGVHADAPVDTAGNTYRFDMYADNSAKVVLEKRESDFS